MSSEVEQLRAAFLRKLDTHVGEFHPNDVNRVKTDNKYLARFLKHTEGNNEEALTMMWRTCEWRKTLDVNSIKESTVNRSILESGSVFPYGKDKDGNTMLVFKTKLHFKGAHSFEHEKRCLIYWLERLERQENGRKISLFFDMDGASLSNMDLDYTMYLIKVLKDHYPDFINYILVFQLTWALRASFEIIKSWLPERALHQLKFLNKSTVLEYVHPDTCLESWGGTKRYVFSFEPEEVNLPVVQQIEGQQKTPKNNRSKKVHFDKSMTGHDMHVPTIPSDSGSDVNFCKDKNSTTQANKMSLEVFPENVIAFAMNVNDITSSIVLRNMNTQYILFKIKTTSPEKFRVRPGVGVLEPNGQATISVSLLSKCTLERDKFLIMSTAMEKAVDSSEEMEQIWKNPSNRIVEKHKLICGVLQMDTCDKMEDKGQQFLKNIKEQIQEQSIRNSQEQARRLDTCIRGLREELKIIKKRLLLCLVLVIGLLFYDLYGSWQSQSYGQTCWAESRDG